MIIALGRVETGRLIDDLIVIAEGKNELHEKNPYYGKLKHSDGWGLAYLDENDKWIIYKSVKPIYEDGNIHKLKNIKTNAVILHVRKATNGIKSLSNTQPLFFKDISGEFLFAHNGSIKDEIDEKTRFLLDGNSDTVLWFNKIISERIENKKWEIEKNLSSLKEFTSANFFLVTPEKVIVGEYYKKDPEYHTMKLLKENESIIISSEVLPCLEDRSWEKIENKTLIKIQL